MILYNKIAISISILCSQSDQGATSPHVNTDAYVAYPPPLNSETAKICELVGFICEYKATVFIKK